MLSGVGAIALLLLLAGLGKKNHELEKQKILRGVALGMAAAETAGLIALSIFHWDFYMVLATFILISWFW